tara:strand:- start:36 stop:659 length:624 start_codon:yes stop_codon:yes gene_type:complete
MGELPGYNREITALVGANMIDVAGWLLPDKVSVRFTPYSSRPGGLKPSITLYYSVTAEEIVCTLLTVKGGGEASPVTTSVFRNLNLQAIGTEVIQTLSLQAERAPGAIVLERLPSGRAGKMANAAFNHEVPEKELLYVALVFCAPTLKSKRAQAVHRMLRYASATGNRRIASARKAGFIPPVGATDQELTAAFAYASMRLGRDGEDD